MKQAHSLYKLIDPRDELPFYVGISQDPDIRYGQHMRDELVNLEKQRRIQSILDDGLEPGLEIIEKWDNRKLAEDREIFWIMTYIDWGIPLTNINYAEHFMLKERIPTNPYSYHLDERSAGRSRAYCEQLGLKAVGWLQYFEINDVWDEYLKKKKIKDHMASMEDVDQFIQSFIPPARIPVLREKDKFHLRVWRQKKQWRVTHPGEDYPNTSSI